MTRKHWVKDEDSPSCSQRGCQVKFNLFTRRHHCRQCGRVACQDHAKHTLKLLRNALPDPRGVECRVCDSCYAAYYALMTGNLEGGGAPESPASPRENMVVDFDPPKYNQLFFAVHERGTVPEACSGCSASITPGTFLDLFGSIWFNLVQFGSVLVQFWLFFVLFGSFVGFLSYF